MADIAIFRINYKSDFILTLQSDAGWLTPFCIKFWTGAPSKAYYAYYDGMSYTHCTPVEGDPTKLLVQFDDHHLPIGDLKFQIGYHFTVADFPTSIEDEVINQASVIIEVDDAPAQVMLDFNGETAPEIEFSLPAYANEAQRIANEQARIAAEEQRIANEQARISAEETRQANEQQRINAEAERVSDFASMKTESEAATAAANIAATLANEKAQLADDKAALAQAAATLANAKAQLAADKAALAQAAATLANEKAALAQQKAEYAQEQGDAAKTEAETAHALNEEVRDDEEARDQAEQIRQQQETARQQAESQRVTDFNAQMQQQHTAYTEAEAARDTAFDEAETERDAKVDAKVADITNLQAQIGYFVCDTASATAAKTIAATGYALTTGGSIRIKMTNANTANAVKLNINNTGAKALFYNGAQANANNSWEDGEVVEVYYDGTRYQCGGKIVDDEPTAESDNLVKSGGIYTALQYNPRFTLFKKDNIAKSSIVAAAEEIITGIYLENEDGTPIEYTKEVNGITYYLGILTIRQGNPEYNNKRAVSIGYTPMDGSNKFDRFVTLGNTETTPYVGVEHMVAHNIRGFKTVGIWIDWDKYDKTIVGNQGYVLYRSSSNGSITTYRYKRDYDEHPNQKILNVKKQPGEGEYGTIAAALAVANSETIINIHTGVYEENHLNLPKGVTVIGIGDVEIRGYLPADTPITTSTNYSTLECYNGATLVNLKITAQNMRYPIHADGSNGNAKWTIKNCIFEHKGNKEINDYWAAQTGDTSGIVSACSAWGGGTKGGDNVYCFNCKFISTGRAFSIHNNGTSDFNNYGASHVVLESCEMLSKGIDRDGVLVDLLASLFIQSLNCPVDGCDVVVNNCSLNGYIVFQNSGGDGWSNKLKVFNCGKNKIAFSEYGGGLCLIRNGGQITTYQSHYDKYPLISDCCHSFVNRGVSAITKGKAVKLTSNGGIALYDNINDDVFGVAMQDILVGETGDVWFDGYLSRIWFDGLRTTNITEGVNIYVDNTGSFSVSGTKIAFKAVDNQNIKLFN